jgi:hypothetical protein
MNDMAKTSPRAAQTVPPDDPTRKLSIVNPHGEAVDSRTKLAPRPSGEEMAAFLKRAVEVAPKYRTELLRP